MSYLSDPLVPYTWEAYLELEAQSDTRYEYHDGAIQGMAGASNRHNEVCGNCYTLLRQATRGRSCKPLR
ncbi:MAG: Uma2 family endonuclease, partial [Bacteroidetes bacterium]